MRLIARAAKRQECSRVLCRRRLSRSRRRCHPKPAPSSPHPHLSGGLENLFADQKAHDVDVPSDGEVSCVVCAAVARFPPHAHSSLPRTRTQTKLNSTAPADRARAAAVGARPPRQGAARALHEGRHRVRYCLIVDLFCFVLATCSQTHKLNLSPPPQKTQTKTHNNKTKKPPRHPRAHQRRRLGAERLPRRAARGGRYRRVHFDAARRLRERERLLPPLLILIE